MADNDGSGGLSRSEFKLCPLSMMGWRCNGCNVIFDTFLDEGYRCENCYCRPDRALDDACTDLCSTCMSQGKGCEKHGTLGMKPSSSISDDTHVNLYPTHPIQFALHTASGGKPLTCMCCGETHDIVLSYLDPDNMDFHMRPVRGK